MKALALAIWCLGYPTLCFAVRRWWYGTAAFARSEIEKHPFPRLLATVGEFAIWYYVAQMILKA